MECALTAELPLLKCCLPRSMMYFLGRRSVAVAGGIRCATLSPFLLDMMAHHMGPFLSGRGI